MSSTKFIKTEEELLVENFGKQMSMNERSAEKSSLEKSSAEKSYTDKSNADKSYVGKNLTEDKTGVENMLNKPQRPRRYKISLLFQQSEVGPIIGRNGANIKEMKEKTECVLNFYNEFQRNRTLVIMGEKEKVPKAVECVAEALKTMKDEGHQTDKNSRTSLFWLLPKESAISLIGKEGANAKRIKDETDVTVSVMFEKDQSIQELLVRITGTPKDLAEAVRISINEYIKETSRNDRFRFPMKNRSIMVGEGSPRFRGQKPGAGPRHIASNYKGPEQFKIESTQSIKLKRELAGAVIGKGGRNISRIRMYSGASIKINTPQEDEEMATVIVVGRPSCVAVAFEYIEECIQIYMAYGARLRAQGEGRSVGRKKRRGTKQTTEKTGSDEYENTKGAFNSSA